SVSLSRSASPRPTTPWRRWPGCSTRGSPGPAARSGSFPSFTAAVAHEGGFSMHVVIACLSLLVVPLQQPGASPLDRPVTLAVEGVRLQHALDEVSRQAGVRIAYSRRVVPLDRPVSARLDAVTVRIALDTLLQGTGAVPTL